MAKLILTLDGAYVTEYDLDKASTSIGRRPSNEIHLDNLAVSGDHAVIIKAGNAFYIEDLNSTNGTVVNNESIEKHQLQDGDIITFGKFELRFSDASAESASAPAFEKTMMMHPSVHKASRPKRAETNSGKAETSEQNTAPAEPTTSSEQTPSADSTNVIGKIQVLNGTSSGRELVLNKAMTTLGKIGVQVAVITKRPTGYFITHVEGNNMPMVNGVSTGLQAHALQDHDVIELAGVKMEFYVTHAPA